MPISKVFKNTGYISDNYFILKTDILFCETTERYPTLLLKMFHLAPLPSSLQLIDNDSQADLLVMYRRINTKIWSFIESESMEAGWI